MSQDGSDNAKNNYEANQRNQYPKKDFFPWFIEEFAARGLLGRSGESSGCSGRNYLLSW
jgi:hypothetical protein